MGSAPPPAPLPLARLAGVGAVVFLANAALLVLQLVSSRLLTPFIGSDLYTWTSIIGVFLTGIALGNALGGRLADRYPTPRTLALLLAAGALAAGWMALFPAVLTQTGAHQAIPFGPRIPLLAAVLCLPAGFVLSLLTPLAIKLGLPDVSKAGRVAGLVFALSTLGCLLGNYVTGFFLIPAFYVNTLVLVSAGVLLVLAAATLVVLKMDPPAGEPVARPGADPAAPPAAPAANPFAFADIRRAYLVVFLASFGGMTLELTASRVLATSLGVSLYTWTGIIGVMLTGTALGNFTGGLIADRVNRRGSDANPRYALAGTLVGGGGASALILAVLSLVTRFDPFGSYGLLGQVLGSTFALFFLPMFLLGMVSPQVIRLAVRDVAHAGRVAGRVYAWSTAGAIAGTFATGYLLLSTLGASRTILAVALVLSCTALLVAPVWRSNLLLYLFAIALGGVTGGVILYVRPGHDEAVKALVETNYYTIKVTRDYYVEDGERKYTGTLTLTLDHLIHSKVNPDDPLFLHYEHEYIQLEFLREARDRVPAPKVLVIGGGGYTFPRAAKTVFPDTELDVVEIDPGVTRVAYEHLGLRRDLGIRDYNMDGRQFVAERAGRGGYDLIVQDAVNDLSVPSHLLTKEYNDAVKAALKPDGTYLLTVIDSVEYGKLWKSAMRTLRETFPHVELLTFNPPPRAAADPAKWGTWAETRQVYVIYAADRPFDRSRMWDVLARQTVPGFPGVAAAAGAPATAPAVGLRTHLVPPEDLRPILDHDPGVLLTDQYAPVDNLMAEVFRRRNE